MSKARSANTARRTKTSDYHSRQQRKKRAKNSNLRVVKRKKQTVKTGSILSTICFLVFIIYVSGYVISVLSAPTIPITNVTRGSIDTPRMINGVIVRDERVYRAEDSGTVHFTLSNHDRTRRGMVVATIQNEAEVNAIQESIADLDYRIIRMQETRDNFSIYSDDVRRINRDMRSILDSGMYMRLNGNMANLHATVDNLDRHMTLRNQMLLGEYRGSVMPLVQDRMSYQNRLNQNLSSITSNTSGIISYHVDGFEESLTMDRLRNLTRLEINLRIEPDLVPINRGVNAGDAVFRIVASNEWYIVSYIENDMIGHWQPNMFTSIYIQCEQTNSFQEQHVQIVEINRGDRESYVILRSTRGMLDHIDRRNIRFQVTSGVYEGLKIPNTAIVNRSLLRIPIDMVQEEETHVMVRRQEGYAVVPVPIVIKVRNTDEGYVYVLQDFSVINIGDVLLSPDGTELYQISGLENFEGVFIINSGIAQFRRIIIDENTPSNFSHTVLDPHRNNAIRVHDRIVSDARNIQEGQTIF